MGMLLILAAWAGLIWLWSRPRFSKRVPYDWHRDGF